MSASHDPKSDEPKADEQATEREPEANEKARTKKAAQKKGASKRGKAPAEKSSAPKGSDEAEPEKRGRLSRLRFSKKKDMPGGLWLKCENCGSMVYRKELEERNRVCPSCRFHFTLPARARLEGLLDPGTFEERFEDLTALDRLEFTDSVPYAEKLRRTVERTGQNEALVCGLGSIEGREAVLAILDFGFLGGSMGEVVGEKFALACDLARETGRPLVCFTSSGGARMHEGALSLMQMAKTCAALAELNDAGGFSVCVMTHPTTGGVTASFASVCDVILAEPGALIGFAGPRVIAATLKQELPKGFQRSEFLIEKGMLDAIVERSDLRGHLGRLMDYAKGTHRSDGPEPTETVAPEPAPADRVSTAPDRGARGTIAAPGTNGDPRVN